MEAMDRRPLLRPAASILNYQRPPSTFNCALFQIPLLNGIPGPVTPEKAGTIVIKMAIASVRDVFLQKNVLSVLVAFKKKWW